MMEASDSATVLTRQRRIALFTLLPQGAELAPLLPDRWLQSHPEHRWTIADRREEERAAKGGL